MERLLRQIGYQFRRPELMREALTHRSFGVPHNERLEFLGDSILNCVIAQSLYHRFPQLSEGELSRVRANLVNQSTLAHIAQELALGEHLLLGEGEMRSGGFRRPSILADTVEAILGAVFLDGGFDEAATVIVKLYSEQIDRIDPATLNKDPKTALQEYLQGKKLPLPKYELVQTTGKAHNQHFKVECSIPELKICTSGEGENRRSAEQAAALAAYKLARGD